MENNQSNVSIRNDFNKNIEEIQSSIFETKYASKSLTEIVQSLNDDGLRLEFRNNGYVFFTCKEKNCNKTVRVNISEDIYIVAWNRKEHECISINSHYDIPGDVKKFIIKCLEQRYKPEEIVKKVYKYDPLTNVTINQVQNFINKYNGNS